MDALTLAREVFFTAQQKYPFVLFVTALILANWVTGVFVAIMPTNPERFRLGALGDWSLTMFVMVGGGGMVSLLDYVSPPEYRIWFTTLKFIIWAAIIAGLVGKIIDNFRRMYPGIAGKIPDWLGDKRTPETDARP